MAYLPDHEPALGARQFPEEADWTSGFDLAAGVDLLLHDAQYTAAEYPQRVGWGHSAIAHALGFGAAARVKRLVTFHHDPGHDDLTLDRLIEEARRSCHLPFELVPGTEGATFDLAGC
jgi:ribonuclease BN (tRNA processing enzyme)